MKFKKIDLSYANGYGTKYLFPMLNFDKIKNWGETEGEAPKRADYKDCNMEYDGALTLKSGDKLGLLLKATGDDYSSEGIMVNCNKMHSTYIPKVEALLTRVLDKTDKYRAEHLAPAAAKVNELGIVYAVCADERHKDDYCFHVFKPSQYGISEGWHDYDYEKAGGTTIDALANMPTGDVLKYGEIYAKASLIERKNWINISKVKQVLHFRLVAYLEKLYPKYENQHVTLSINGNTYIYSASLPKRHYLNADYKPYWECIAWRNVNEIKHKF